MSNITIATVALAIFSVSSFLGGIVLIIMEVLDEKKEREREKRGRWFHSMDIREEVEKGEDE